MGGQMTGQVAWPHNAWRLRLLLDVPSLNPPAVQYAIFSEDPVPRFAADLERAETACRAQLRDIHDADRRQTVRRVQLAGVWNRLFRVIGGDQVYLAIPGCSDPALMSSAPQGNKWLVTKPVQAGGRVFCWSVPFAAVPAQEVAVNLSEHNALDLTALDHSAENEAV